MQHGGDNQYPVSLAHGSRKPWLACNGVELLAPHIIGRVSANLLSLTCTEHAVLPSHTHSVLPLHNSSCSHTVLPSHTQFSLTHSSVSLSHTQLSSLSLTYSSISLSHTHTQFSLSHTHSSSLIQTPSCSLTDTQFTHSHAHAPQFLLIHTEQASDSCAPTCLARSLLS